MKKICIWVELLIIVLLLTACVDPQNVGFVWDSIKVIDSTFDEIVTAIQAQDSTQIAEMFAPSIKSEEELLQDASMLISYIRGDIVSFSSAEDRGVGTHIEKDDGKRKEEIEASFCLETTETSYYVAMKECVINDFDNRGIGIIALHIIESGHWTEEYVYRGDGNWTPGIVIDIPS